MRIMLPWPARHGLAKFYPERIFDHMEAAKAARETTREVRRRPEFRAQAEAIVTKHASRKGRSRRKAPSPKRSDQLSLFFGESS
tara:strand:+ start:922 stop:1173 length:252 start_codon:yes stop_codon:yes gene_type:complete